MEIKINNSMISCSKMDERERVVRKKRKIEFIALPKVNVSDESNIHKNKFNVDTIPY
jgi:hypothetical protein